METIEYRNQREEILKSIIIETPVEPKEILKESYAQGANLRFSLNLETPGKPILKLWILKSEDLSTTHAIIDQLGTLRGITGYIKQNFVVDSYSVDTHNRHRQEKFDDTIIKSAFERFLNS